MNIIDKWLKENGSSLIAEYVKQESLDLLINEVKRLEDENVKLKLYGVSKRLYGVYCNYDDDDKLISVHITESGASLNKLAQTDYSQNYYYVDFVILNT